jgi:nucleoside phosphorylase
MSAAKAMLDETHEKLPQPTSDQNTYTLGEMYGHNIVIACLPSGVYGTISAATVATRMLSTFTSIRFGLMVGIGGGVPSQAVDIRVGDIVVSQPTGIFGGVVQYDRGKVTLESRLQRTGALNKPPQALLTAMSNVQADHYMGRSKIPILLSEMLAKYPAMRSKHSYPGSEKDYPFKATYDHVGSGETCEECDQGQLLTLASRASTDPQVHYGLIASGNQVMKNASMRDQISQELGPVLCFETEAAGLMDHFPCLVIRGICDYSDSHKNKRWQEYAAAVAAAYSKELLSAVSVSNMEKTQTASDAVFCGGTSHYTNSNSTSMASV